MGVCGRKHGNIPKIHNCEIPSTQNNSEQTMSETEKFLDYIKQAKEYQRLTEENNNNNH